MYPECNFKGKPIIIKNTEFTFNTNTNIKSIKSIGYAVSLFEDINFKGEQIYNDSNKYNNECFATPIKSFFIKKITPKTTDKTNNIELYSECDLKGEFLTNGITYGSFKLKDTKRYTYINFDVNLKSIKTIGYKIFLYQDIDFKGTPVYIDGTTEYITKCFEKPIKSIIMTTI